MISPEPTPYRAAAVRPDRRARQSVDLTVVYAAQHGRAAGTWSVRAAATGLVFLEGPSLPGASRVAPPRLPGHAGDLPRARAASRRTSSSSPAGARSPRRRPLVVVPCTRRALRPARREPRPRATVPGWRRGGQGRRRAARSSASRPGVLVVGRARARRPCSPRRRPSPSGSASSRTPSTSRASRAGRRLRRRRDGSEPARGLDTGDVVGPLRRPPRAARRGSTRSSGRCAAAGDTRLVLVLAGARPGARPRSSGSRPTRRRSTTSADDLTWKLVAERTSRRDVFALLSRRETWGVVVNEAAACGPPARSLRPRRRCAIDLLRDGENGVSRTGRGLGRRGAALGSSPPIPTVAGQRGSVRARSCAAGATTSVVRRDARRVAVA